MTISDCFVSVIAPSHDDSNAIGPFITESIKVLRENYANYELVLIDDGSEDDTVIQAAKLLEKNKCIRLIQLSRKFGEEIAISAGLDSVIGDFIVIMLPNYDPPELIPKIVQQARHGTGIVFGISHAYMDDPFFIRVGSALFHWYCRKVLKLNLPRNSTQFCVLSRQAVNAILQIKDKYRYLRILSSQTGYATQCFEYEPINRNGKSRKRDFFESVNLALNIIIRNSCHPLRFVSWFGISASIINILYTGFIVYSYIFGDKIAKGWTTLSLQNSIMFFFVFLTLTVLSEYIGHILIESEDRPLYYVLGEKHSSVLIADQDRLNVVTEAVPDELIPPVIAMQSCPCDASGGINLGYTSASDSVPGSQAPIRLDSP